PASRTGPLTSTSTFRSPAPLGFSTVREADQLITWPAIDQSVAHWPRDDFSSRRNCRHIALFMYTRRHKVASNVDRVLYKPWDGSEKPDSDSSTVDRQCRYRDLSLLRLHFH